MVTIAAAKVKSLLEQATVPVADNKTSYSDTDVHTYMYEHGYAQPNIKMFYLNCRH